MFNLGKNILFVLIISVLAYGESPYKLSIVRNNKTLKKMAYPMWSGEHPLPVIDVNSDVTGTSTIDAFKTPKDITDANKITCTIPNAIYHPWSADNKTTQTFYFSIKSQEDYAALKSDKDSGLIRGDRIQNVFYTSEGVCSGVLQRKIKKEVKKSKMNFNCECLDNRRLFKRVSRYTERDTIEQWLQLSCQEGYTAYISDQLLLQSPNVQPGVINNFYDIGPK